MTLRHRIVFMASDPIALPSLQWCRDQPDIDLVAVFTQPDRPTGRGRKMTPNAIKVWAQEHGITLFQPEKLSAETTTWMQVERIDLNVVMAYGHFLKQPLLDAPQFGTINLHGSILPRYRGACPLEAAILDGLDETGISLMRLVRQMDAGPVMDVEKIPIYGTDTALSLRERASFACPTLLARGLPRIFDRTAIFHDQPAAGISYVRRLFKSDGQIDFTLPADAIERRSRAFNPWPGLMATINETPIKFGPLKTGAGRPETEPGTVIQTNNGLGIQCGEDAIFPQFLQKPGGKMLPIRDFLNGFPIACGMRLAYTPDTPIITDHPQSYATNAQATD